MINTIFNIFRYYHPLKNYLLVVFLMKNKDLYLSSILFTIVSLNFKYCFESGKKYCKIISQNILAIDKYAIPAPIVINNEPIENLPAIPSTTNINRKPRKYDNLLDVPFTL